MTSADQVLAALHDSHDRLAAGVESMTPEQISGPAYPSEWSVADVLSHLGSGAVLVGGILRTGVTGEPTPGPETFQPVWDEWNAKPPAAQAADGVAADQDFIDWAEGVTPEQQAAYSIEVFGRTLDFTGALTLRLGEQAVHIWDVLVTLDPSASLTPATADLLLGGLPQLVARTGKPVAAPIRVAVLTEEPSRQLLLDLTTDSAALSATDPGTTGATVTLPAEAFVRLVYGRLDAEHTPASTSADGIDLDTLRGVFPGF